MRFFDRLKSDYLYLAGTVRLFARLIPILRRPNKTISDQIERLARQHGDQPALIHASRTKTFSALDEDANRYARWAIDAGVGKGDVVALLMSNRPEFVAAWVGIARAGGVAALLNTNQVGASLSHSLTIVAAKHVVVGAEMAATLATALPQMQVSPRIWVTGGEVEGFTSLDPVLEAASPAPLEAGERVALTIDDPCLYIYTSGTSGPPKAATISHYRVLAIMNGFSAVMGAKPTDRIYIALPLYHSSGGLLALGATLTVGGAAILKDRFSASEFWPDIVHHRATMFQYIGELCRYLLNAPMCAAEGQHTIRLICGNGLRPDIWPEFKSRFKLPKIVEFYGATEGNVVLLNHDGKVGSVGRIPFWAKKLFPIEIIAFDFEKQTPVRDASGHCRLSPPGEVGEMIGRIDRHASQPTSRFDGYADKTATSKKILHDVFGQGDLWFRTGDLMRRDAQGHFYFVDRVGDTFRWKGENVSTSEVAEALSTFLGIGEANVYGVEVAHHDGRAGMAALVWPGGVGDLDALSHHLRQQLPAYARPVFLRITDEIEATTTFKQRKVVLQDEGFDPEKIADALFVAMPAGEGEGGFQRLTPQRYASVTQGNYRL
ncbi:MAG: long-chain-acyl-CoA synthetase [Alphaproteobacteria bacterium]